MVLIRNKFIAKLYHLSALQRAEHIVIRSQLARTHPRALECEDTPIPSGDAFNASDTAERSPGERERGRAGEA